jgi:hypothetical protein
MSGDTVSPFDAPLTREADGCDLDRRDAAGTVDSAFRTEPGSRAHSGRERAGPPCRLAPGVQICYSSTMASQLIIDEAKGALEEGTSFGTPSDVE